MKYTQKILPIIFAILVAFFYALNTPISKLLLNNVSPSMMAGFLYIGAGLGISFLYIFQKEKTKNSLTKKDWPYVVGMIVLDVLAPIF